MDAALDPTLFETLSMRDDLFAVFEDTGDIELLENVITLTNEVVEKIPQDHPQRTKCTTDLLIYWDLMFRETQDLSHLHRAIGYAEEVLEATPHYHPGRPCRLGHLAFSLYTRYQRTEFMDDLDQAISYTQQALGIKPLESDERVVILNSAFKMFQSRFDRTRRVADIHSVMFHARDLMQMTGSQGNIWRALSRIMGGSRDDREHAIAAAQRTLAGMPDRDPRRGAVCSTLAMTFYMKYQQTEHADEIRLAISFAKKARAATPVDSLERADRVDNLKTLLDWRQRLDGAMHDLGIVMDESRLAAKPGTVTVLGDLATKLYWRYEQDQDPNDHDRASVYEKEALALLPEAERAAFLNGLEHGLELRCQTAVSYAEVLLESLGPTHPERGPLLTDIADTLFNRYLKSDNVDKYQLAISFTQHASTHHGPDQIRHLNNLSTLWFRHYQKTYVPGDLQEALSYGAKALAMAPPDHRLRLVMLNNQATRLHAQYSVTADIDDLTQAITYTKIVLAGTTRADLDRVHVLVSMSDLMALKYQYTQDVDDMRQVVPYAQEALATAPLDYPDRPHLLNGLATKFYWRYKQTAAIGDIRQAEFHDEQALKATTAGAPSRALYLSNLAAMRHASYQRLGAKEDLDAAIGMCKEALITKVSPRDPVPARYLVQLARYFELTYNETGAVDDARQSVLYGKEALDQLQLEHPARVHLLSILSRGLSVLHENAGEMKGRSLPSGTRETSVPQLPVDFASLDDSMLLKAAAPIESAEQKTAPTRTTAIEHLQQAISYSREALEATPQDHPERSPRLQLVETLESRYQRIVTIPDLLHALLRDEEALAAKPEGHPDRHRLLGNLIRDLMLLPAHSQTELTADKLGQFIRYVEEWASPEKDSLGLNRSAPLASLFFLRYLQTKDIGDLQQAIMYNSEVIAGAELQDNPRRTIYLLRQAVTMYHRYLHGGDMDDLDRAISYGEESVNASASLTSNVEDAISKTSTDQPRWVDQHGFLADCCWARYKQTGDMRDVDREILHREQSLASAPPEQILAVKSRMTQLSESLRYRYEETRELDDLKRAIWCAEEGYDLPSVSDATNLHLLLSRRYERSGDTTDLHRSITYASIALDTAPAEKSDYTRAGCLTNLAGGLHRRYLQYHNIEDLNRAISLCDEALGAVPEEHPNRAGHLQNMAALLGMLYKSTESTVDFANAIKCAELGLAATQNLRQRAGIWIILGDLFYAKHTSKPDLDNLQQAISYAEEALAGFPQDHPARGVTSLSLGQRYLIRSQQTDSPNDLTKSIVSFKEAWGCSHMMPYERVRAARGAATGLMSRPDGAMESYSLLQCAVLLLPEVSPRSLGGDELMSTMLGLDGLAADAASTALVAGFSAYDALKLLELSRGVMTGIAIDCRSDLSDLSQTDSTLFNKFNNLRTEIDTPLHEWMAVNYRVPMVDALRRRREGADKMTDLIAEIRNSPGHEGFQLPLSPTRLMSMAKDGAIVTISSSAFRSDAIIITSTEITSIPLPKLSFSDLQARMGGGAIGKLSSGTLRTYASRNNKLRELLLWLWEAAVWPVLQQLQFTAQSGSGATDLPHIWWIGTGLLGAAPFHAAGDYSPNSDPLQNTMSYAVSSYTPTIKSLSYAREKELTILGGDKDPRARMLLVAMPVTPGEADLPDVAREVSSILEVTKGSITSRKLVDPSATQVLTEIESYGAIHLACHGISDATSPANNHLILLKNGMADPLTIRRISRRNTATSAQLAYLSACSTAESTGAHFADECLHIASGFQLAGFSHVLAAMWSAESKVCVAVSTEFYRSLFDGRGEGHRKVRTSFHEAVKKVHDQYRRSPLKWAPFIHMGA